MLRFTRLQQATTLEHGVITPSQLGPGLRGTCIEGLVNFEKAVCTYLVDWQRKLKRSDLGLISSPG